MNNPRIAIITSKFNTEVTQALYEGAVQRLAEKGIIVAKNDTFFVPGAVEIPVVALYLARSKQYDAIITLGAVIRGETDHYDYVCESVTYGCQNIAVKYGIPVIFGVLTTDNEEQALARAGGSHSHKGVECADAALEMIEVIKSITESIEPMERVKSYQAQI
jgi:6,7-dimethyl-8-ribityllumazine synthase